MLKLYFALSIIGAILQLMILIALCCIRAKNLVSGGFIALVSGCCMMGTCCYSFACLIILHVYRYQPSGKFASLDWMTSEQLNQLKASDPDGLNGWSIQYYRGQYLQGLVIYTWITVGVNCCIELIFKRNRGAQ